MTRVAYALATVSVLGVLLLAGCGGGDGGNGGPQPHDWTLAEAMALPNPNTPGTASSSALDRLAGWMDGEGLPEDDAQLQDELDWWCEWVQDQRNDPAGQLGLMMVILATASRNGADALGYDLFEELGVQDVAALAVSDTLGPAAIAGDALATIQMRGVPKLRPLNGQLSPAADDDIPPADELEQWRAAIRTHLLPALADAQERLAGLAASCNPTTALMTIQREGETYSVYAADCHALNAALGLVRSMLLGLTAVNMNYGGYDWSLDLEERDANGDGKLTVAEYAPAAPFGAIEAASWTAAGQVLRNAVSSLISALAPACLPSDPNALIQRALADAEESDLEQLRTYLSDALAMLSGQVNVEVEYARWEFDSAAHTAAWVDEGSTEVPLNLRQAWDSPPASIQALLPPLYKMLAWGDYLTSSEEVLLSLEFDQWTGNQLSYRYTAGASSGTAPIAINNQAHGLSTAQGQANISADWSTCTLGGDSGVRDTQWDDQWEPFTWVPRWDEIPDRTISGIFPDPEQVRDLILAHYDRLVIRYGSFEIVYDSTQ
ncbi:MAG: hypothetical protein AB7Y46_09465 [Armatimonadota bacterium]